MKRTLCIMLTIALLAVCASAATEPVLKKDLSEATVNVEQCLFMGMPVTPLLHVYLDGKLLTAGEDYVVCYEQNVNAGDAIAVVIGCGDYYGTVRKTFQIEYGSGTSTTVSLKGNYLGVAGGTLNEENIYYDEMIVSPGRVRFVLDCNVEHVAAYQLYRIEGENATLIKSWENLQGDKFDTEIEYDFTSVYETAREDGYGLYLLSYAWGDAQNRLYGGAMGLVVPAKVDAGATMFVEQVQGVGSFRTKYLTYYSEDGILEPPEWSSSDTSIASVGTNGIVTLKKPGTVTITAKSGGLSRSIQLVAELQELKTASIYAYESGYATVVYDGYLLVEGTDYIKTVSTQNGVTVVAIKGENLFAGELLQQFDAAGHPIGHSHYFAHECQSTCSSCDYSREASHTYGEWVKTPTHHCRVCAYCGGQAELAEHTFAGGDTEVCSVCGPLIIPGDFDGNYAVNEDDAIYLLRYVLMPTLFPIQQNADYTGDGTVNEDDAIHLLRHVLMPGIFPLK